MLNVRRRYDGVSKEREGEEGVLRKLEIEKGRYQKEKE